MQPPETRYATRPDGVSIAYQVLGEGPLDLVFCFGFISHLDLQWASPEITRFFRRLASFSRLILFDKAGTGLSDPIAHVATLEERVDDVRVVMDAAHCERAALFGESEGGPTAMLFAATYPDRTAALVLYGTLSKGNPTDDELAQQGLSRAVLDEKYAQFDEMLANWGQGLSFALFCPSQDTPLARRAAGTFERAAVSPGLARALIDTIRQVDIAPVAASITAPTLLLHRREDFVPVQGSRSLAAMIPGARYVELDGTDHAYFSQNSEAILDQTQRFLTGSAGGGEPDRVLATIVFTDIVDSTRRAAEMGDSDWRSTLQRHEQLIDSEVSGAGGRVVKFLGDGALATFTGPARAIRATKEILAAARGLGLELRAGVHTGECEAIGADLGGLAVHIGARVSALAAPGEILVSGAVKDLVAGSGLRFADRGEHKLKGVPGGWALFAVSETDEQPGPPLTAPLEHMTMADRATVLVAHRAPGVLRAVARVTQRSR